MRCCENVEAPVVAYAAFLYLADNGRQSHNGVVEGALAKRRGRLVTACDNGTLGNSKWKYAGFH
jgi:hypothetical protein